MSHEDCSSEAWPPAHKKYGPPTVREKRREKVELMQEYGTAGGTVRYYARNPLDLLRRDPLLLK